MSYRYKAAKKAKPSVCPYCGAKKFSRLEDTYTGKLLDIRFGLCSACRTSNYPSKEYAQKHLGNFVSEVRAGKSNLFGEHINVMDYSLVEKSHRHSGNFYDYLCTKFPKSKVDAAWDKYQIGITKAGDVIYWQMDRWHHVFTGEVVSYLDNGKRDRDKDEWWTHNRMDGYNMSQVLFGLHLVPDDKSLVFVVEGAKNALIASIVYPQCTWTSVHSRGELGEKKLYAIRRHPITAIPDIDAIDDWRSRAEKIKKSGYSIDVIDFRQIFSATKEELEYIGNKGDIADLFLLRSNPYELPTLPELSAIINTTPTVKTLCLKFHLMTESQRCSFGIFINGRHYLDYTDPGQVFYHIESKQGHRPRTAQEWMNEYISVAGFHSPKDPNKFFSDHASEYFLADGDFYTFKFNVELQELRPCSDGTPRYMAVSV